MKRRLARSLAMLTVVGVMAVGGSGVFGTSTLAGQEAPNLEKLANAYSQAWAKGDAAALAALHAPDAIRMSPDGTVSIGRAAIQKDLAEGLSGPFKGSTLTINQGQLKRVTADVYVGEGTYEVVGGSPPEGVATTGHYVNTIVRQGNDWLIASNSANPGPPGM
jgi:uncharacterized protein (TIGR02246 family)